MTQTIFFNVHLVSDSTGETLNAIMRAACAQFENVEPLEHFYYLVRSEKQLSRVLDSIERAPGVVWFTISDFRLREILETFCQRNNIPFMAVIDRSIAMLSRHLGVMPTGRIANQHKLDQDYFRRIEALNYTLAHDDGQNVEGLRSADVILLGVSRTSKTPTCVYLGNRGVRAGNIPLVPGVSIPDFIEELDRENGPVVIGLKVNPERLVEIRRQRLLALNETSQSDYADEDAVRAEVTEANRLFQRNNWKTIDVSRRSVEETAAAILTHLSDRRK